MAEFRLFDFLNLRNQNVLQCWAKDDRLSKNDKAKLNQKINRLAQMDFGLAVSSKLLNGPIHKHVYKLKIHGDVMLRPMLCRGPIDVETEYTFLFGAVEIGGRLPEGSLERAEGNRITVMNDETRREEHQSFH